MKIKRLPQALNPELGKIASGAVKDVSPTLGKLIAGTGGSSPYLYNLILTLADWLPEALQNPAQTLRAEREKLEHIPAGSLESALRQAKSKHALLIGLADLAGVWSLDQVTATLTKFADLSCHLALMASLKPLARLTGDSDKDAGELVRGSGLFVLAMGKMGAYELNYSSDIDLICLFDETKYSITELLSVKTAMTKVIRCMSSLLSRHGPEGYVFRTDFRLRPDPAVTPIVMSTDAAERYYESLGRTWERAAFIKARVCAGDFDAGQKFLQAIKPFIWRRHLDFTTVEDTQDMRLLIRDQKGPANSVRVPGHDLKLGIGGIREIECLTQTLQLIAGGRNPKLRLAQTTASLAALADAGWVASQTASSLIRHYRFYREIEHRIQMIRDAQTHRFPTNQESIARIACLSATDRTELLDGLRTRLEDTHGLIENFFLSKTRKTRPESELTVPQDVRDRWQTFAAFKSVRARQLFDRLQPQLLSKIKQTANPEQTFNAIEGFLSGLPAGAQIFSLLQANPRLLDLLVDIAGTSSSLASYLSRNSSVFDAVIDGDFFSSWPKISHLEQALSEILQREDSYEGKLDAARSWAKEWHFRIGVHHLRRLIENHRVGEHYADLATAVIRTMMPVVIDQFSIRHGRPPGRGAAIMGMGSLGSRRMTASSDLDIILIYDHAGVEFSEGPKPLATRNYYANLTKALITALSAPTSQGKLYAVDMRLRPSGNQGPVATNLDSFRGYQRSEAWIWEHMALSLGRIVAGPGDLGDEIENFRQHLLSRPQDPIKVAIAIQDMRRRLNAEKKPSSIWDAKFGSGRLQDLDLIAQAGTLISGEPERAVEVAFENSVKANWLTSAEADFLTSSYWLYLKVIFAMRLLVATPKFDPAPSGGGAAFLARIGGVSTIDQLQTSLQTSYEQTSITVDEIVARGVGDG
ncbi:MAG: glutamine-synthetase adenylyltransferase [Aestuariivita sp.]|nr:glutamine-synthetase adenylyltransferase [Aestuariivita sp.]